ncbi:MAG: YbjQ family protein [Fibrobacter sp.]|nr:YbjQ family protein [Fibrobacter sp.]
MLIVNTDYISGKEIETIQLVKGSIVFSKNVIRDIFAGLKTLVGGEIAGYSEMMSEARQKATERMIQEATAIGADAIVNVRYSTSNLMASAAEIIAYGTAVRFKK